MATKARKPRQPTTIEDALARAYELLHIDEAERVTGRPRSMLWAMSDPAKPERPNHWVMLALDCALLDIGEPPVIKLTYAAMVDAHAQPRPATDTAERVTLALGAAVGDVQRAVAAATNPDGSGGAAITPREWSEIGGYLLEIERQMHQLRSLQPAEPEAAPRMVPRRAS